MPKTKKKDELALELDVAGRSYRLVMSDYTGSDDLAIYRETGLSVADIFAGQVSLFTVAALLWRHRVRNGEPGLTYAAVNDTLTFDALETVRETNDAAEGQAPEASGGS